MKSVKSENIMRIVNLIMCIFGIIMLKTYMHPCFNDKAMKCNASHKYVCLILIGVIAVSLIEVLVRNSYRLSAVASFVNAAGLIGMAIIPQIFGTCMKPDMVCNTRTFPFIYMFIVALAIVRVSVCALQFKHKKDYADRN